MDVLDNEILSFWNLLEKEGVRYILIGGFATNFHGYNRVTADMDLWIEDSPGNRRRLRKAIKSHGSGDYEMIETMQMVAGWTELHLKNNFRLDLMTSVKGLENVPFDECYELAVVAEIEKIPVRFLHYNHLVQSKRASNRLKDQLDLEELARIRES
jgi:hypothetical protein